jgi:hypothetical protein
VRACMRAPVVVFVFESFGVRVCARVLCPIGC